MESIEEKRGNASHAPQVGRYDDYRRFLKDYFEYKKEVMPHFSFRGVAKKVGMNSPNYLQMVISGRKGLALSSARRLAEYFRFSDQETDYFQSLVEYSSAQTSSQRQFAGFSLRIKKSVLISARLKETEGHLLSKWYYLPVRELVNLKDFKADPEYICRKLCNQVSKTEAEEAWKFLLENSYVHDTPSGYVVSDKAITTGDDTFSHSDMKKLHDRYLENLRNLLHKTREDLQGLHILNIPMPISKIPELLRRIDDFQSEIIGWLAEEPDADCLVQLGTYALPFVSDPQASSESM